MTSLSSLRMASIIFVFSAATAIASAQTFKWLTVFDGTDGANPGIYMSLVQGIDGNFYGTTAEGGANNYGTVFEITPAGKLTTLYSFCSQTNCTDGDGPTAGLVQATDGNFYGTTTGGGANGYGTVFKISAKGTLTTLYSFCSQTGCTDGYGLSFGLLQGSDGNLYGTTYYGGANSCLVGGINYGCGTVFKITPSGTLTTLHSFDGADGYSPVAALVEGADGNFYGTTIWGGANSTGACATFGCGTVFKITPRGTLTTLYSFCSQTGCTDGSRPEGALVQGTDGNFYGTTNTGGANGYGTVFKITPAGTLTTLYSFACVNPSDSCPNGVYPYTGLMQGTDGNFYGTTEDGGMGGTSFRGGTVFEITPQGTLTTLHSFGTEGPHTPSGLIQATNGSFYGATYAGTLKGETGYGTVFSFGVGLGPFVETRPTSGKVGAKVIILGNKLAGATSVSFNGTAATFTASGPEIKTTVPTGATTGTVEVTTPSGTLSSNVPFRVTP